MPGYDHDVHAAEDILVPPVRRAVGAEEAGRFGSEERGLAIPLLRQILRLRALEHAPEVQLAQIQWDRLTARNVALERAIVARNLRRPALVLEHFLEIHDPFALEVFEARQQRDLGQRNARMIGVDEREHTDLLPERGQAPRHFERDDAAAGVAAEKIGAVRLDRPDL